MIVSKFIIASGKISTSHLCRKLRTTPTSYIEVSNILQARRIRARFSGTPAQLDPDQNLDEPEEGDKYHEPTEYFLEKAYTEHTRYYHYEEIV